MIWIFLIDAVPADLWSYIDGKMRLCYLFYSEEIRSLKATERSMIKPNTVLHCGLPPSVCTISLVLNFCIILKYLNAVVNGHKHFWIVKREQRTPHLLPRTSLSIQKQWLVAGLMFLFPICNRLKLSKAKWWLKPHDTSVRGSDIGAARLLWCSCTALTN